MGGGVCRNSSGSYTLSHPRPTPDAARHNPYKVSRSGLRQPKDANTADGLITVVVDLWHRMYR